MRSIWRRGAVIAALVLATAMVAVPAQADTAEVYLGNAAGRALDLSVLGNKLTFGSAAATASSVLTAKANAAGQLAVPSTVSEASATSASPDSSSREQCGPAVLPEQTGGLLSAGLACSSSIAQIKDGLPLASGEGSVASIDLHADKVLGTIIQPVALELKGVLDALPGLDQLPVPITSTVGNLLDALDQTETLAVRIGKTTTDATAQKQIVTSSSSAAGGQVDILPQGGLNGLPVASIIIGDAHAVSTYDRSTGASTAKYTPAIATIRVSTPALSQEIPVTVGQTVCILDGTPLKSCVIAGDGSTSTAGGKSVAVADGVKLDLLQGVSGGVVLELAHAEAGVEGTPASKASPIAAPKSLPRTGGLPLWPLALGVVALAASTRRLARR